MTVSQSTSQTPSFVRWRFVVTVCLVFVQAWFMVVHVNTERVYGGFVELSVIPEARRHAGLKRNDLSAFGSESEPSRRTWPTFHALNGLYGNATPFIDQWEVHLKSVLLNAPLDTNLHIHVMANGNAFRALQQRLQSFGLHGSRWRNKVRITVYDVERHEEEWRRFLTNKTRGAALDARVSLGGYYRLMADRVLLSRQDQHEKQAVNAVLYMDTDVVVLSNLNDLHRHVVTSDAMAGGNNNDGDGVLYRWSGQNKKEGFCPNSGFAMFYLQRFRRFWQLLDTLPAISSGGDQVLLTLVHNAYPNVTAMLPDVFDAHLGHGWRPKPHSILTKRDGLAMVHFTGRPPKGKNYFDASDGVHKYCLRSKTCGYSKEAQDAYRRTWGLADYYVRLPWHMVRYLGQSLAVPTDENGTTVGYELRIEFVTA